MHHTGFHLALDGAMIGHFERTHFGKGNAVIMGDAKTRLREGEAVIASIAFEARKTRFLSMFCAASEEGLHGQIDPHRYVLQDLGMHAIKGSAFSFQEHKGLLLLKERQARTILLIGVFALPKQVVIEPTALFKGGIELVYLFLGREYPVLKHFAHVHLISLNCSIVKRWDLSVPRLSP